MSDALLIGIVVVIGAALAYWLLSRKPAASMPSRGANAPVDRENMLQIAIPASGACCDAARKLETHRFHKGHVPSLPLEECSMKQGCHCRYQPVPDRRIGARREGGEKRDAIRYEENPRRKGRGRRSEDKLWDRE
jgi:hypothetical protein